MSINYSTFVQCFITYEFRKHYRVSNLVIQLEKIQYVHRVEQEHKMVSEQDNQWVEFQVLHLLASIYDSYNPFLGALCISLPIL